MGRLWGEDSIRERIKTANHPGAFSAQHPGLYQGGHRAVRGIASAPADRIGHLFTFCSVVRIWHAVVYVIHQDASHFVKRKAFI